MLDQIKQCSSHNEENAFRKKVTLQGDADHDQTTAGGYKLKTDTFGLVMLIGNQQFGIPRKYQY